jgi:hypothetical protein
MLCSMKQFFLSLIHLCLLPHHPLLIIYSYILTILWMLHILPFCWLTMVQVWGAVHVLSYSTRILLALPSTSARRMRMSIYMRPMQTWILFALPRAPISVLGRHRPRPLPRLGFLHDRHSRYVSIAHYFGLSVTHSSWAAPGRTAADDHALAVWYLSEEGSHRWHCRPVYYQVF